MRSCAAFPLKLRGRTLLNENFSLHMPRGRVIITLSKAGQSFMTLTQKETPRGVFPWGFVVLTCSCGACRATCICSEPLHLL